MDYIGLLLTSSAAAQQFKQAWLHSPCTMIQPALAKSETWVNRYSTYLPDTYNYDGEHVMGCLCKQIFNVRLHHALAELVNTLTSNSAYGFISTEFEHPPITRTKVAIILQTCPLGHSIHHVHTNLQCHAPYILFFTLLPALCTFCLHYTDIQRLTQCRQISIMPTLLSARATPVRRFQGVHLSV